MRIPSNSSATPPRSRCGSGRSSCGRRPSSTITAASLRVDEPAVHAVGEVVDVDDEPSGFEHEVDSIACCTRSRKHAIGSANQCTRPASASATMLRR
ncbi:hypothetical protein OV090_27425 [Nannocystis sp. RBIL2]|uniref:hypothetical protein n=1 Tax=Nannocystis sp. RBIL2 TaxID=2996788 RepID=UPI0022721A46|nr:hypothetical protein [Nannocystis sp. RBIL2]MCY1068504.1 hypothetical protein [Nannocystis sp. RBIL2]